MQKQLGSLVWEHEGNMFEAAHVNEACCRTAPCRCYCTVTCPEHISFMFPDQVAQLFPYCDSTCGTPCFKVGKGEGCLLYEICDRKRRNYIAPTRHGEWRLQCPGQSHPCGTGGNPRKFRCCTRLTLPSSLML